MNLYQTKLFATLQKQYKNQFGADISQFVKPTNSLINFAHFEEKHLTIKQKNVIKSIQKNSEKKIILSDGIASGKTYLACYLFIKSLIANKSYTLVILIISLLAILSVQLKLMFWVNLKSCVIYLRFLIFQDIQIIYIY